MLCLNTFRIFYKYVKILLLRLLLILQMCLNVFCVFGTQRELRICGKKFSFSTCPTNLKGQYFEKTNGGLYSILAQDEQIANCILWFFFKKIALCIQKIVVKNIIVNKTAGRSGSKEDLKQNCQNLTLNRQKWINRFSHVTKPETLCCKLHSRKLSQNKLA